MTDTDTSAPALSYAEKARRIARQMVSLEKRRYQRDGFDLDLTYITPRVIAMGWPTEEGSLEAAYRNPMPEVQRFFKTKHTAAHPDAPDDAAARTDHYKIYNVCWERAYDVGGFFPLVSTCIPFLDHNCPPFQLLVDYMHDADAWLRADPRNVIAIHCKAGKGRTGLVIAAYLLHTSTQALKAARREEQRTAAAAAAGGTAGGRGAEAPAAPLAAAAAAAAGAAAPDGCQSLVGIDASLCDSPKKAIEYFGRKRTNDGKGLTIVSQMRYVFYYGRFAAGYMKTPRTFSLSHIRFVTVPAVGKSKKVPMDWNLEISMWGRTTGKVGGQGGAGGASGAGGAGGSSSCAAGGAAGGWQPLTVFDYKRHNGGVGCAPCADEQSMLFRLDDAGVRVCGDVKFVFSEGGKPIFRLWFHTAFVDRNYLCFGKNEVDKWKTGVIKKSEKKMAQTFDDDFKLEIFLQRIQDGLKIQGHLEKGEEEMMGEAAGGAGGSVRVAGEVQEQVYTAEI